MNEAWRIKIPDSNLADHRPKFTFDDGFEPRCSCPDCDHLYPVDCQVAKEKCCLMKKPVQRSKRHTKRADTR